MEMLRNPDDAIGTLMLKISDIPVLDEDVVEFLHVHDDGWGGVPNRTGHVGLIFQPFQPGTCHRIFSRAR